MSTPLAKYEPDILAKGLDVVFCGLNPASTAEVDSHNFSSRSNRFWRVLHLARRIQRGMPEFEAKMRGYAPHALAFSASVPCRP